MNKDLLLTLVNKVVKVDRGGPESRVGMLLTVGDDYFTIFTKDDGVVYYKTQHIKSVSIDSKGNLAQEIELPENVEFFQGEDFKSVIKNLRHSWVKANRGGPETIEGILNEAEDEYVTIFSKHEVIHLSMFHVRNISFGVKEDEEKEENKKQDSKSNSRSSRK